MTMFDSSMQMQSADESVVLYQMLASIVREYGLEDLLTLDSTGAPVGWLWDKVTSGVSEAQFLLELEQTESFKRRYPAITELRRQSAAGQPVRVPTVNEVRAYEQQVSTSMRLAGLPTWFYDEPAEVQGLMSSNLSAVEVEQRLGEAWIRTQQTDPEIRRAFDQFYGVGDGDAALAAFFLDPQRTVVSLERASRAAYTAGMGRRAGLSINQQIAERIAATGRTEAGIQQDIQEVTRMGSVFDETMGERDTDLEASTTGIEAVSLGSAEAQAAIERRITQRRTQVQSQSGGALVTERGAVGLRQV
jgi:hypothetical protein